MGDLGVPNQAPHSGRGRALSPTLLGESRSPDLQFLPVLLTPSYSPRRYISEYHCEEHLSHSYGANQHSVCEAMQSSGLISASQTNLEVKS